MAPHIVPDLADCLAAGGRREGRGLTTTAGRRGGPKGSVKWVWNDPYYDAPPPPARPNAVGTIGGAVIGAAIGSQVGHGDDRIETTAIGAVLGGIIGSNF